MQLEKKLTLSLQSTEQLIQMTNRLKVTTTLKLPNRIAFSQAYLKKILFDVIITDIYLFVRRQRPERDI